MLKYLYFLAITFFIVAITGCSSVKSNKVEKLNKSEYEKLVQSARTTLLNLPTYRASEKDKEFVKETPPVFRVKYNGYKTGKYLLKWELPSGKTLQVFGKGNMLDYMDSFEKVSIVSIEINDSKHQK